MGTARLVFVDDATPALALQAAPCALVIGNFDGVHRGHQAVLSQAVADAAAGGIDPCALTFDPHPAGVVGRGAPPLLTSLEDRAELMGAMGVTRVYVRRFDAAFAAWSPERFATELVSRALDARLVVVGQNFRFGSKRAGDLARLREFGTRLGFETRVHAVAADERGPYSSTRARDAVAAGDLNEAKHVLGRPHAVTGRVVAGEARGRALGFRTANLAEIPEMLPPNGVYAVAVDRLDPGGPRRLARGVTNVGVRPTIASEGPPRRTVETHLLDFEGDLYDARLRLQWLARLRDEKKFGSLPELVAQIGRDVEEVREVDG